VRLNGGTIVIPAATDPTLGLVITGNQTGNAQGVLLTNHGQIAPSNQVAISGNGVLNRRQLTPRRLPH
jgi:hypothetical protein